MEFKQNLRSHLGTIGAGFLLAFLSSFGQTYFIALSGTEIRLSFDLSHGGFGAIFSIATLLSGVLMIWAGGFLDRVSVRSYAAVSMAGVGLAALALSYAPNILVLGLALFGLRFFGPGMLSHAAITSVARLHGSIRGRATGFATLGFTMGEAVLPIAGVAAIAALSWVGTWQLVAMLMAATLVMWLFLISQSQSLERSADDQRSSRAVVGRLGMIRDWRFLVFLPSIVGLPAIMTGYFFHQLLLAQENGWSLGLLASSISFYALASVGATLLAGALVDRFSASSVSRFHLLPLLLASALLPIATTPALAPVFFALVALSAGAARIIVPSVLAELFGVETLGTTRALAAAVGVIASAISPALFGILVDQGVTFSTIGLTSALYLAVAASANFALPPLGNLESPVNEAKGS